MFIKSFACKGEGRANNLKLFNLRDEVENLYLAW